MTETPTGTPPTGKPPTGGLPTRTPPEGTGPDSTGPGGTGPGGTGPGGWNTDNLKDFRALRRSGEGRKVAGVAEGLARHLDVDPTVLRVLFVVLAFFGGSGLALYGALWLVVPEEESGSAVVTTSESARNAVVIGSAAVAAVLAVSDGWNGYGFPWPVAIVGIVVAATMLGRDRLSDPPATTPTHEAAWKQPGYAGAPDLVPGYPAGTGVAPESGPGFEPVYDPGYDPGAAAAPYLAYAPAQPTGAHTLTVPRPRGPLLFGPTVALLALALGALGVFDGTGGGVPDAAYPALALALVGAMLVVGAFVGRPGGLVTLGVVAALALPATALAVPSYAGDRELLRTPSTAADLDGSLSVPAGRIHVDLTSISDLEALDGRTLTLDVNAGEVLVVVPEELHVTWDAEVRFAGMVETPRGGQGGVSPHDDGSLNAGADSTLHLDLRVGVGQVEVRQP